MGHQRTVEVLQTLGCVPDPGYDIMGKLVSDACKVGDEVIVSQLLNAANVDINVRQGSHQTALWLAAEYGHDNIVKLLLDLRNGDNDLPSGLLKRPLALAVENGHKKVVKLLLDMNHVDLDVMDDSH